ncbi:hypothetical protein EYF80_005276 [Liparis tanakae]|uniref:Uncharacterized protein n=1 Tax=Liparis tanakae TaxID=230148 RepID=A0A4Z2J314_9TELE|nr:hypothetical protein EYF80_005276 [Liparis tanakae]
MGSGAGSKTLAYRQPANGKQVRMMSARETADSSFLVYGSTEWNTGLSKEVEEVPLDQVQDPLDPQPEGERLLIGTLLLDRRRRGGGQEERRRRRTGGGEEEEEDRRRTGVHQEVQTPVRTRSPDPVWTRSPRPHVDPVPQSPPDPVRTRSPRPRVDPVRSSPSSLSASMLSCSWFRPRWVTAENCQLRTSDSWDHWARGGLRKNFRF